MRKGIGNFILVIVLLAVASLYYYIALPAVNIHSPGLWVFILSAIVIIIALYSAIKFKNPNKAVIKTGSALLGVLVLVFIIGSFLSSPVINSMKYQKLLTVTEHNFTEDIKQVSYNEIPILDKDSAAILATRKMGGMVDMVSQFEVSNFYTQINYEGKPVRVTPLEYGNFIKWFTNRSQGIPAYIKIDMTTQDVEAVRLQNGIRYSFSERFGRNVNRHLRFNYPTYIFDTINFELDDNGNPVWICPVKDYTIGLFGGVTVGRVVILNAVTGEMTDYAVQEVPTWVDKVYSAELLISQYDYYGTLKHGYLNSVLGQKDSLQTTDGYNYVALDDDVWVYTGITSVGGDESNVGFVLMNQRTKETRYYAIPGAEEYSAMSSAEGQVQHLGYRATFPLLLNIANEPTYFIALKDNAGLVKNYAMVNIEKYQIVAIGETVSQCEKTYKNLLNNSGISTVDDSKTLLKTGVIKKISEVVIDGNTHYYILLNDTDDIFDVLVSENINIVKYNVGDSITFEYTITAETSTVLTIRD